MSDFFGPIFIVVFCFFISRWELKKQSTIITPFGVMVWPYVILVTSVNWVGKFFGFYSVSLNSILFVMVCLLFFILGGQLVGSRIHTHQVNTLLYKNDNLKNDLTGMLSYFRPLFITLSIVAVVSGIIHFYRTINEFSLLELASSDFRDAYGTGVFAHIMLLGRPAFIFLFVDYIVRKKKTILFLLIILLLTVGIRQVKYHIFILILGGLYFSILSGLIKFTIPKIILYSMVIYLIFNLSYVIGFSTLGIEHAYSPKVQAFLFNHFFTYLFGGPIGFSEILKNPHYPLYSMKEVIAAPLNIVRFINGDSQMIDIIIHQWMPISTIHRYFHSSNVFTMFGMLYAYIGTLGTWLYCFFIGLFSYAFGALSFRNYKFIGFQLVYIFILGFLTLSFFGFYFNMLTFLEICFVSFVIPCLYILFRESSKFALAQHIRL